MGSRVMHAEDDGGGTLESGLLHIAKYGEWVCSCNNSLIKAVKGTDRINVYGVMWLRMGMTLVCHECGDACRLSPTISFVGTPEQRPPKDVGGFVVEDEDEDEMEWEDDDDEPEWVWDD